MIAGANLIRALPGLVADTTNSTRTSFAAEEVIEFGRPLMRSTNPERQVKNFVSNGSYTIHFLGISARSLLEISGNYPIGREVTVLEQGRIWVPLISGLTIVASDTAFLNEDTNSITNVVSTHQIPIGRFITGGTSNGLTGSALFELEVIPGFQI